MHFEIKVVVQTVSTYIKNRWINRNIENVHDKLILSKEIIIAINQIIEDKIIS
jgi:hypothetical protein